jgi:nitroreductase
MTGSPLSSLPPPAFGDPIGIEAAPEVLTFLARRRSASALKLAAPGPDAAQVQDLLRLACRVPDHGKLAPWRFILLEAADKDAFADRLEALARARGDERAAGKLGKLRAPPLGIAVISAPREADIPEWEQVLSAGAVCMTLACAAQAMGFGANWITDWYAYDAEARACLGVAGAEKVAGFILIGSPTEPPRERERPDPAGRVSRWTA